MVTLNMAKNSLSAPPCIYTKPASDCVNGLYNMMMVKGERMGKKKTKKMFSFVETQQHHQLCAV